MKRSVIGYLTHVDGVEMERRFNHLPEDSVFDRYILTEEKLRFSPHIKVFKFDFGGTTANAFPKHNYPPIWAAMNIALLDFYKKNPNYQYYWLLEYDMVFTGNFSEFFHDYDNVECDFLTSQLYHVSGIPAKTSMPKGTKPIEISRVLWLKAIKETSDWKKKVDLFLHLKFNNKIKSFSNKPLDKIMEKAGDCSCYLFIDKNNILKNLELPYRGGFIGITRYSNRFMKKLLELSLQGCYGNIEVFPHIIADMYGYSTQLFNESIDKEYFDENYCEYDKKFYLSDLEKLPKNKLIHALKGI